VKSLEIIIVKFDALHVKWTFFVEIFKTGKTENVII